MDFINSRETLCNIEAFVLFIRLILFFLFNLLCFLITGNAFRSIFKFFDTATQAFRQFRDTFTTKEQQQNKNDQEDFCAAHAAQETEEYCEIHFQSITGQR